MENSNGSGNTESTSIQKQIIDGTIRRLVDGNLFTQDQLNLLKTESLCEPWSSPDQLDKIVNPVKTQPNE